ncbi:putative two-component system sensor protein histidine kinase [Fulvivirga imtechensis AK7]|uniref:Putative two-component system sensor protein histidine kinase n=1 Tax=Fulvivirga imtechensis AK7 TaxID=1237149 RepID=L8JVU9_9BACT|nr:sensor histidine kinase [Fulvivirga imtechensis]ELR72308.1 putative two-component system sensor protein histidine kinase [Fulvivirga imtechensis AK7]
MKKIFINHTLFRLLVPPFYGALVYLLILLVNNNVAQISEIFTGQEVYVCIGLSYLLSETLRLNVKLAEKLTDDQTTALSRIILQTLSGLILSVIVISLTISAYFTYILQFSITETQLIIFNSIFAVSSLLYNLLYFSNYYLYRQNLSRLETEKMLTENLEIELGQFKNEVNPKLLYDSLETLITLIHKNNEEAEDYIDHLSLVYRYILSHRKIELSSLDEEIKAANNITHLLNYQYDNTITFKANIPPDHLHLPMVPGSLPGLVESIIRSTIINKFNPLIIELAIEETDGYLILSNKLNDRLIVDSNRKEVVNNLQRSYSYFSEKPVVQVKAYNINYIKIPILELAEEKLAV